MNSKNMLLQRRWNRVPVFQRSHIALEFIHRSYLAGVAMLGSDSDPRRPEPLFARKPVLAAQIR
ncbi:hypothetical protein RS75_24955 [Rhizobium nepotum 39/7]|uniref:Uncharacterized protein n=1 Tax=Rhizobium nepotum 39/7 TaxID=1368418 RepID=A0ABR5CKB4_9HYPH|nr:hypothetical protein RS75_24955 [Rhizobium nepotum 39/7]